MLGLE